jgi:Uri superfamily endonuclease
MCSSCSMGSAITIKRSTFMTKEICFCLKVDEAPSLPGAYAMAIELSDEVAVTFSGRLRIALPAGRYLYCGSAKGPGGLKARLSRHMRRGKSVRWHVDQLTEQGLVIGSWIFPGGDECRLVQMCSHLPMPIAGFGSSDCATCRSHLLHWSNGTALPTLISADAFKASWWPNGVMTHWPGISIAGAANDHWLERRRSPIQGNVTFAASARRR